MFKNFMERIRPGEGSVGKDDYMELVKAMTQGDGTITKPSKAELESNTIVAPSMVRIYYRFKDQFKKAATTKKGKTLDPDSKEFIEYAYTLFNEASLIDAKYVVKNGWYTKDQLSSSEKLFLEKVMAGENVTVSDVANPEADDKEEEAPAPAPVVSSPVVVSGSLETLEAHQLISVLIEGLQYDRFDAHSVRESLFAGRRELTLNNMIIMCSAYIFVGNNINKLGKSVKQVEIGNQVAQVLNSFDVKAKKVNQKTVTLARIGIMFSPVIWALRNIMKNSGKLQTSGVVTTTPSVLQDVSLSGVSGKITGGDSIEDFLVGFNKVLTQHKEKGNKEKTSDADIKTEAQKWWNLAKAGITNDPLVSTWDFNSPENMTEVGIRGFYEKCLNAYAMGY